MKALLVSLGAILVSVAAPNAWTQVYPAKPVRLIIPFAAGRATDVLTRIIAVRLPEVLGQQVVIDNRTKRRCGAGCSRPPEHRPQ